MDLLYLVELTRVSSAAIPTGAKGQPGQSWWGPTSCFKRPEGTWRLLGLTSSGWGGDQRESLWRGQRGPGWGGGKTCPPGTRQGTPRQETWATSKPSPQGQKNQHRQRVNKSTLPGLRQLAMGNWGCWCSGEPKQMGGGFWGGLSKKPEH